MCDIHHSRKMEGLIPEGETFACHTPRKLQAVTLEYLVTLIIKEVIPSSANELCASYGDSTGPVAYSCLGRYGKIKENEPYQRYRDPRLLDEVLMCTGARDSDLIPHRAKLLEKIQLVSQWINKNSFLGSPQNHIRKHIRNAMTDVFEVIDPYSHSPLYKFLLELVFSSKVGGCADGPQFPFVPRVNCELWKKDCPQFADILRPFAPFYVEELSTCHIMFGDNQALLVVIENAPYLKTVHLRQSVCEEILTALSENCPLLETLHMDKCLGGVQVPVDRLYRTFFRGKDCAGVMELATKCSPAERQDLLTFPNLKCINFGPMNDLNKPDMEESLSLFIYTLLRFYSRTMNVICGSFSAFEPALPRSLPECLRDMTYSISNCSVNGFLKWTENNGRDQHEITDRLPLKQVRHLSLFHNRSEDNEKSVQKWITFSRYLLPKLGCKIFSLYIILEGSPNVSTFPLYKSLFADVGSALSALHLNLCGNIDLATLCAILSQCPNLECLRIRLGELYKSSRSGLKINPFRKLTSMTLHSSERSAPLVHDLVEALLRASPELTDLSLVLPHQPCEWLMSLALAKKLNGIRVLRLSFHPFNFSRRDIPDAMTGEDVGISFYVYLLELLVSLKVVHLGSLPQPTFMQVKNIYRKSDLQLGIWHVPRDSKEWYGAHIFRNLD